MRKLAIAILALALSTCAHVRRKPAADSLRKGPITCAETFASVLSQDALEKTYEIGQFVMSEVRTYTENAYPEVIASIMLKASKLENCEIERALNSYQADINTKIGYFVARMNANKVTLGQQILTPGREAGEKWACLSECAYRQTQTANALNCAKRCAIDPTLAEIFDEDVALKRLGMTCFQGVTDKNASEKRKEYANLYEKAVPAFLEKLAKIRTALQLELTDDKRIYDQLTNMRAHFLNFRRKRPPQKCEEPQYPWSQAAFKSNIILRSQTPTHGDEGTAFYFKTGGKRYLATAVHVIEPDLKLEVQNLVQKILASGQSAGGTRFDFYPGLVSLQSDVIIKPEETSGPSLELAAEDEIPQFDQKFWIAGYPTFGAGEFRIVECTFYGFGPREADGNQSDASYLLRCPGVGDMKGVSGGPMLDEKGRAWGVASLSERYSSTMRAIPLSAGKDGNPKILIQQRFLSDICYESFKYRPHECYVMPNMYDKEIP